MNRRLFSYSELPLRRHLSGFVVIGKAESVAVAVQSLIIVGVASQSRRCAYRFSCNGHIFGYVFLADRFALSVVAVLTRSSCPIVPMMQSTLPRTPHKYPADVVDTLHNQGCGSAMLKQVWHCVRPALDYDNGYVFRHY